MAITTTLSTELEAINLMLEACEEAPVSSLATSGLYPLDKAKGILSESSRVVQSMGWHFNTEPGITMPRSVGDNLVTLPSNTLRFDPDRSSDLDLRQRGLRLYDAKGHSYSLPRDIKGTAVFLLGWDELPQAARQFIAVKAARTMQGRSSVSESTYRYSQADEDAARLALEEDQSDVGNCNMLRDSLSVGFVLQAKEDLWAL